MSLQVWGRGGGEGRSPLSLSNSLKRHESGKKTGETGERAVHYDAEVG